MKTILQSKTVWINVLFFIMAALPLLVDNAILPAKVSAVALPLINLALRIFFTVEPLSEVAERRSDLVTPRNGHGE